MQIRIRVTASGLNWAGGLSSTGFFQGFHNCSLTFAKYYGILHSIKMEWKCNLTY